MARRSRAQHHNAASASVIPLGEDIAIDTGTARVEEDPYRSGGLILYINGVPSSHVVIGDPQALEFEYMRWIAAVINILVHSREDLAADSLRITHLGGAGCSLARYFADLYPKSRNTVVELDAKLGELVRTWFDIPRAPRVKIRAAEARQAVENFYPSSREIIIRDVFAGDQTPRSLATVEFFQVLKKSLTPTGIYIANCGDHKELLGARAELAGLREVFSHVGVVADPPMLKGRRYGNIILVASDGEIPAEDSFLQRKLAGELLSGAVPAQYHGDAWVKKFVGQAQPWHDKEPDPQG